MRTDSPLFCMAKIRDVFGGWRKMGSRRLRSGTELIGRIPDGDGEAWLHVVHRGLSLAQIDRLERRLGQPLPRDLRALYRRTSGMALFHGAFCLFGHREPGVRLIADDLQPDDLLAFNHELDVFGWKPRGALAVAENGWDLSVHVLGMTGDPLLVHRCERTTGRVLETHSNIWVCVAARLYKLDQLLVRIEGAGLAAPTAVP